MEDDGVGISPDLKEAIAAAGVAVGGLIAILTAAILRDAWKTRETELSKLSRIWPVRSYRGVLQKATPARRLVSISAFTNISR